jgi:hypothetical protein
LKSSDTVYFVYGTHGDNPSQIDDYIKIYTDLAEASGLQFKLTFAPIAGAANILMECFSDEWTTKLVDLKKENPATRYLIVCTEYLTGETFNYFPKTDPKPTTGVANQSKAKRSFAQIVYSILRRVLPSWVIGIFGSIPGLKKMIHKKFGVKGDGWASPYFEKRFKNFKAVADVSRQIVVVGFDQLDAYVAKFGKNFVGIVPSIPYVFPAFSATLSDERKDIDFLFSGSMTAYRKSVVERLRQQGYRVEAGFWGASVRQHFVERAKVCLHIRQYESWVSPSVMRLHQLLISGALVVSETTSPSILQDKFIQYADPADFVDVCVKTLAAGNFSKKAKELAIAYYNECGILRQDAVDLMVKFVR